MLRNAVPALQKWGLTYYISIYIYTYNIYIRLPLFTPDSVSLACQLAFSCYSVSESVSLTSLAQYFKEVLPHVPSCTQLKQNELTSCDLLQFQLGTTMPAMIVFLSGITDGLFTGNSSDRDTTASTRAASESAVTG